MTLIHERPAAVLDRVEARFGDHFGDLHPFSFAVEPGQSVALVGATGAGKTSIISLLMRFYDVQKGDVLLDGVPIDQVAVRDLRERIGLVLQDEAHHAPARTYLGVLAGLVGLGTPVVVKRPGVHAVVTVEVERAQLVAGAIPWRPLDVRPDKSVSAVGQSQHERDGGDHTEEAVRQGR